MAGSVLFGVLFVVILALIALGVAGPLWLIPVVVVGLGLMLLAPVLSRLRESSIAQSDPAPSGVPSTRDASYEPVRDPAERRP